MVEQVAQQRIALLLRKVIDADGVRGVDKQAFPAGDRMRAHDRMRIAGISLLVVLEQRVIDVIGIMDGRQAVEMGLHAR